MKKKAILVRAMYASLLLAGTTFVTTGCKDYDDDIRRVSESVNQSESDVTSQLDGQIELITEQIKTLESTMNTADAAQKEDIAGIIANLTTLSDALTQMKADCEAGKAEITADVEAKYKELAALIEANENAIAALTVAEQQADAVLQDNIDDLTAKLEQEVADRTEGDANLQTAIDELQAALEEKINGQNTDLSNKISELQTELADQVAYWKGQLNTMDKTVTYLDGAIGNFLNVTYPALVENISLQIDAAVGTKFNTLSDKVTKLESGVAHFNETIDGIKEAQDKFITEAEETYMKIADADDKFATKADLEADIEAAKTELNETINGIGDRVSALENTLTTVQTTANKNAESITEILGRLTTAEGSISEAATAIAALQTADETLTTTVASQIEDAKTEITDQYNLLKASVDDIDKNLANYVTKTGLSEELKSYVTTTAFNETKKALTTAESEIDALQSAIAEMDIEGEVAKAMNEQMGKFFDEIKEVNSSITEIESDITNLTSTATETSENVLSLKTNLGKVQEILDAITDEETGVEAVLNARIDRVKDLIASGDAALQSSVDALSERVATLETEIEGLDELEEKYNKLTSKLEEKFQKYLTIDNFNTEKENIMSEVATDISTAVNELKTELEARISKLESEVTALGNMIQSIVFVSDYADDAIPMYIDYESQTATADVTFIINTNDADFASKLASNLSSVNVIVNQKSRAIVDNNNFSITKVANNGNQYTFTIQLDNSNDNQKLDENSIYEIALSFTAEPNNITSEFIEVKTTTDYTSSLSFTVANNSLGVFKGTSGENPAGTAFQAAKNAYQNTDTNPTQYYTVNKGEAFDLVDKITASTAEQSVTVSLASAKVIAFVNTTYSEGQFNPTLTDPSKTYFTAEGTKITATEDADDGKYMCVVQVTATKDGAAYGQEGVSYFVVVGFNVQDITYTAKGAINVFSSQPSLSDIQKLSKNETVAWNANNLSGTLDLNSNGVSISNEEKGNYKITYSVATVYWQNINYSQNHPNWWTINGNNLSLSSEGQTNLGKNSNFQNAVDKMNILIKATITSTSGDDYSNDIYFVVRYYKD